MAERGMRLHPATASDRISEVAGRDRRAPRGRASGRGGGRVAGILEIAAVAIQPTFLLIADIAGYTRFMKFHRASLAHAQEIVAQLPEAVIDATDRRLTLTKLEGDAAFFYVAFPPGAEPDLEFVAEQAAAIYRAFHTRVSDLKVNSLCTCDGCMQAGNLEIKLVGHLGKTETYYVDLERYAGEVPASPRLSMGARIVRHLKLSARSLPSFLGLRQACAGFRHVKDAPPLPAI